MGDQSQADSGYSPDKDDKDTTDYVPITSAAKPEMSSLDRKVTGPLSVLVEKHGEIIMACRFPSNQDEGDERLLCRPQAELSYIESVVTNWQPGVHITEIEKGPECDHLASFCKQHQKGNKYIDLSHVEDIHVLGSADPCTVIRRIEKGHVGRIVFFKGDHF